MIFLCMNDENMFGQVSQIDLPRHVNRIHFIVEVREIYINRLYFVVGFRERMTETYYNI